MPTPTTSDLALYLGVTSIDSDRATLILGLAVNLCESIVTPLPDSANVVVLAVAARAFANPEGITGETVGPYTVQRAAAGMYLTKSDKATLRRLAGGSGAFSIDTLPTGVNAVQLITVAASAGTFKLALSGQSTTALAFGATSSDLQTALGALSLIGAGNVTVSGSGPFVVTFVNDMGLAPIPTLTADVSALTGTVTVATTTHGVFRPGANLPYWDRDYGYGNGYRRGLLP